MKNLLLLFFLSCFFTSCNFHLFPPETVLNFDSFYDLKTEPYRKDSITSVFGKVTDRETGESLIFANIAVFQDDKLITGVQTDFDGLYNLKKLDSGLYNFECSYVGYRKNITQKISVFRNSSIQLNLQMRISDLQESFTGCGYPPIINQDDFTQERTFSANEIKRMAW